MERSFVVTAYRPEVGPQQLPDLGSMGHVWGQLKTRVGWHSAASQESLWGFTGGGMYIGCCADWWGDSKCSSR